MKKPFLILILLMILSYYSFGQQGNVVSVKNITSPIASVINEMDTLYELEFSILLSDTMNIRKLNVMIGTSFNSDDVLNQDFFVFETENNPQTFFRDKLKIIGSAGNHYQGVYFYKITVEDFQGNKQTPFIRQL